jgi:hypothetical protein
VRQRSRAVRQRNRTHAVKHAAPHQARSRVSAVKIAAVPALTAVGLGLLAFPAFALLGGSEHVAGQATARTARDAAAACQAWEPVLPGLLYLGTAPVLTIGGVPLLGHGTCLPASGKGDDIAVGADIAVPPQSVCDSSDVPLPLLQLNLGLAIGVPDEDGYDPCQARVRVASPAPATPPQVVPPRPAQVVPPHVVPPHVVPPRPPQPVAPTSPGLGSPPPPPPPTRPAPRPTRPAPPSTTPATTPAAVLPPPRRSPPRPPRPPQPAPPVTAPAAAAPVTVVAKSHPKPRPHAKPAPARPAPYQQAAPAQPPASTYKPGRPVMPVGVLVTVVMTPCVATVAARLGRVMAGR